MHHEPGYISTRDALAILLADATAERAVAEPGLDPCPWAVCSPNWLRDMLDRADNPLPVVERGPRGRGHTFDPAAIRRWFAEEFERQAASALPEITTSTAAGIQVTASALARELGMHPHTLARRIRDWNVAPAREVPGRTYYRLGALLDALTAAAKAEDPDSLPPTERDAHYRAEGRKDDLLRARGELRKAEEVARHANRLARVLTNALDLIPDTLESRCQLGPEALALVEQTLDAARTNLAEELRAIHIELTTPPPQETTK
jgi:phage terminase Nu1 subunit (DNA packaging protein)